MAVFSGSGQFSGELRGSYSVGEASVLEIGDGCTSHSLRIDIADSRVIIGRNCRLNCVEIYARGSEIRIGDGTGFTWNAQLLSHEASRISIGGDCLIASNVIVSTSDMHSIVEADSGARINPPQPIDIGDHVWLGQNVFVLKGVTIGSGSIVGAASMVTRDVPAKSLAAGSPVKVMRSNVTWRHDLIPCRPSN